MAAQDPRPLEIERALQGASSALAAKDAVYHLARSGLPGAKERLTQLIREEASVATRRRAALGLSLLADARAALLDVMDVTEPPVLSAVLLSLARVGIAEDVRAIQAAAKRLIGPSAEQARFAELLLAHRLGLSPEVVPPIATPAASESPLRAKQIAPGNAQEAARAWSRFVPNAHLGFEPDPRRCATLHCAQRHILIIPSMALTTEMDATLRQARMVVGATASYEREAAVWHHDLWIFSTPTADGVELQAWTQGGLASYTGTGRATGDVLAFELRTTAASHLALIEVRGRLSAESLDVEGVTGDRPPSDAGAPVPRSRPQ
jgi:hypothetical protein